MNKLIFLFLFSSITLLGTTQQLQNIEGRLMEESPYFNASFIREHKIKYIVGSVSYKDEMQPIRKTAKKHRYRFDRLGRLIKYSTNYYISGKYDSSYTEYTYSKENYLIRKKVKDAFGMHLYTYKYNSNGDLTDAIHTRPSNRNIATKVEQYKYEYYGNQQKKKLFLNDELRIFREENINYNDKGQLDEIYSKYTMVRNRESKDFMYDSNGFLQKLVHISQNSPKVTVQFNYENDERGNPLVETIIRNGKLLTKKEFLFKNDLIDAILKKDELTQRITITELEYSFY